MPQRAPRLPAPPAARRGRRTRPSLSLPPWRRRPQPSPLVSGMLQPGPPWPGSQLRRGRPHDWHRAAGKGGGEQPGCGTRSEPGASGPYIFYDSVEPGAIPPHHLVATYATGPYAVPAAQVADRQVMWIDTIGSDPHASALDIEPTDATPVVAANWARAKLTADPHALARLYTNISEWPAVQAAVATLPPRMRSHIRWWIADPTGYPPAHRAGRGRHSVVLGDALRHLVREASLLVRGLGARCIGRRGASVQRCVWPAPVRLHKTSGRRASSCIRYRPIRARSGR